MESRAFIGSLQNQNYLPLIKNGLEWICFKDLIPKKDANIFIKPNLTFPTYRPGVMTSPQAIEAALIAIKDYTKNIFIGDSDSGGYNRFSMDEVYRETGIFHFEEKYGVKVVNLSKVERIRISFSYQNRDFFVEMPRLLTEEIDLLITMPVPKVHANTGVSLTFKNQWGCIPEPTARLRLHPYIKHVLIEINKAVKTQVAIIDGRYGLNGNGPMNGIPVELNWVLVANSIGAGAALACELMQVPLNNIEHLRYAKKLGYIPDLSDIHLNTGITPFIKEKFYLKRKWTDLPGVMAFRNPLIAYLAYFSPLADFLHRILYLFREPFYEYNK